MTKKRPETLLRESRLTPWVGRILLANAVVFVVLQTVLIAPVFTELLQFRPESAARRPWTFLTYAFVHTGVLRLFGNLLLLFIFGPSVERRFGGKAFLTYYLYCGVGAAALALGLSSFIAVPPLTGATGAALGLALAFAFSWPDADTVLYPLPLRLTARSLVVLLAGMDLVLALWITNGAAHLGFLGGLAAGYLFFRVQALVALRQRKEPRAVARRPVMAPIPVRQGGTLAESRPALVRAEPREEYSAAEVDRVLDKISAYGIQSLTADERRFLDEVSKRKRKDVG